MSHESPVGDSGPTTGVVGAAISAGLGAVGVVPRGARGDGRAQIGVALCACKRTEDKAGL